MISKIQFNYKHYFNRAFLILLLFTIIQSFLFIVNGNILFFQIITFLLTVIAFNLHVTSSSIKNNIAGILVYQLLILFIFKFTGIAELTPDYYDYEYDAISSLKYSTYGDYFNYLIYKSNLDVSDLGYTIILSWLYYYFGVGFGQIVACIVKILAHIFTCLCIYRISLKYLPKENALLSSLLFGVNIFSTYFISTGLKEGLFCLFVTLASYYLIESMRKTSFKNVFLLITFVLATALFRFTYPFYFILALLAYFFIRNLKSSYIYIILCSLTFLALMASNIIGIIFPELTSLLEERNETYTGVIANVFNLIGPYIMPVPAISANSINGNLVIFAYSLLSCTYAIFALLGVIETIRRQNARLYPIIFIVFINALSLSLSAASTDPRYTFPVLPLYLIFVPIGFSVYNKKKILIPYYGFLFVLMFMFNNR